MNPLFDIIHFKQMTAVETFHIYFCQMYGRGFLVRAPYQNKKGIRVGPIHEEVCGTDECARTDWYLGRLTRRDDDTIVVDDSPKNVPGLEAVVKWVEIPNQVFDQDGVRRDCPEGVRAYFETM